MPLCSIPLSRKAPGNVKKKKIVSQACGLEFDFFFGHTMQHVES